MITQNVLLEYFNTHSLPAPNITEGLLVLVQLVMADITTEPVVRKGVKEYKGYNFN